MKTAVCFSGTARSLQYTHKNIKEKLILPLGDCDIFSFISKNNHCEKFNKFFSNMRQTKKVVIEEDQNFDSSLYKFRPNWPDPRSGSTKDVYLKMISSRERLGQILLDYEKQKNITYDRVIFSRLDIKYFDNVVDSLSNLDLNNLYVPDFHNTFGGQIDGCNDRFAVSSRENMINYFNLPQSILDFQASGGCLHAETFLKWHLVEKNINIKNLPVRFTRVRSNGEEIDTRIANGNWRNSDT